MKPTETILPALAYLSLAVALPAASLDGSKAIRSLSSDAEIEQKARACQVLAVVGGAEAVPALAALLGDQELAAYARSGLEEIDDPAAAAALRSAAVQLDGLMLLGVVNSLGVKRDEAAVPMLQKFASAAEPELVECALAALGRIANAEAAGTVVAALGGSSEKLRLAAAEAAVVAVEQLEADGKAEERAAVLKALGAAELPDSMRQALELISK